MVHYRTGAGLFSAKREVKAVDGVSLEVSKGETLGLVGESGCGKSTLGRAILRLTDPTAGSVRFDGVELTSLGKSELRALRRRMQMVFQDPFASFNPKMTVRQTLAEPVRVHKVARNDVDAKVTELLETVGLNSRQLDRYPRDFSGGQRQRIAIARALASEPDLIVADEPLASLDVSIQAQIMNLLKRLQRERGLTYLFISHDLRTVRHFADRIAVMYLGRIVETGPAAEVYSDPLMPYTKALLSAVPLADPTVERTRERIVLRGDIPSPAAPPSGCPFHTRCPWAIEECRSTVPDMHEIKPGHFAACIRISPERPHIETAK
jgi:oligopeptide/dipeptide ABC transporter ATP-binding protein